MWKIHEHKMWGFTKNAVYNDDDEGGGACVPRWADPAVADFQLFNHHHHHHHHHHNSEDNADDDGDN